MVFQLQFALFEAAQLQLVVVPVQGQHVYDSIQVAMFHIEFDQAALDFEGIIHVWHSRQVHFKNFINCSRKTHTI